MESINNADTFEITRVDSDNKDFSYLIQLLDKDLLERYGEQQGFFNQFNKIDKIKNVVVSYMDGIPVGCGAIKQYNTDCMEIKRMFVKEQYRGKGIAARILSELEAWSSELNYNTCILETGKNQPEAIHLYQKVGYVITENYAPYIGVDISLCMSKKL